MKKLFIAAIFAMTAFTVGATATKADAASTLTKKQAAKKIAAAQIKAVSEKKTVKVTVKIKANKKNVWTKTSAINDMVSAEEFGFHDAEPWWKGHNGYGSRGYFWSIVDAHKGWSSGEGSREKVSFSGEAATIKYEFDGTYKHAQGLYKEYTAMTKVYDYLQAECAEQSEIWRAAYVLDLQDSIMGYSNLSKLTDISYTACWKSIQTGKRYMGGICEHYAAVYQDLALMAGIKHVGIAYMPEFNHDEACIRLEDGRMLVVNADGVNHNFFTEEEKNGVIEDGAFGWTKGQPMTMDEYADVFLTSRSRDSRNDVEHGSWLITWENGKKETVSAKVLKDVDSPMYSKFAY